LANDPLLDQSLDACEYFVLSNACGFGHCLKGSRSNRELDLHEVEELTIEIVERDG
jgi:hypothetical protein